MTDMENKVTNKKKKKNQLETIGIGQKSIRIQVG